LRGKFNPTEENSQMRRFLIATSIAALASLALASGASAKPMTKSCIATSPNVTGKLITGTLFATNVDPSQARFATCAQAMKVMVKTTEIRVEKPRITAAFRCTPTVRSTNPDVVAYKCVFKGADTATFIKLTFEVKYDQD
jgi:hypothetical protein